MHVIVCSQNLDPITSLQVETGRATPRADDAVRRGWGPVGWVP